MSICPHDAKDRVDAMNSPEAVALRVAETQRSIDQDTPPTFHPISPFLREAVELAEHLLSTNKRGAADYVPMSQQERVAKALRHLGSWLSGRTDEDHYAAAMTNLMLGAEARRRRRGEVGE